MVSLNVWQYKKSVPPDGQTRIHREKLIGSGDTQRRAIFAKSVLHQNLAVFECKYIYHSRLNAGSIWVCPFKGAFRYTPVASHEVVSVKPGGIGKAGPCGLEAITYFSKTGEGTAQQIRASHCMKQAIFMHETH